MMERLSDDLLDNVAGGVSYSDAQLNRAGVIVETGKNGAKIYMAELSTGKTMPIEKNVATGMVESYKVAGGIRLSDQQIKDLIAQSR
ncbi:MAG: hypothetical protein II966_02000 [Lachnospiraceae bacterium]|nr:hypothetical protein [Lachnospiraceae bacterium]